MAQVQTRKNDALADGSGAVTWTAPPVSHVISVKWEMRRRGQSGRNTPPLFGPSCSIEGPLSRNNTQMPPGVTLQSHGGEQQQSSGLGSKKKKSLFLVSKAAGCKRRLYRAMGHLEL